MARSGLYAEPRIVTDLTDCHFYHTTDVPGYGLIPAEWDLRQGIDAYLGGVDFAGKRVLELGTASGFVCFHMERKGADVVAYDLSDKQAWDVVPFSRFAHENFLQERKEHIRRLNNAYWLCHRAFGSNSKVVYGDVYSIPREIGLVDIATCGAILIHVRDPFLALQNALSLCRETVIITDRVNPFRIPNSLRFHERILRLKTLAPSMKFLPDWRSQEPKETWWRLSPEVVQRFIGVLGFEKSEVTYHYQTYNRGKVKVRLRFFTIVGHRTAGLERS